MNPNRYKNPDEANSPVESTLEDFYFKTFGYSVIFGNNEEGWLFRGTETGISIPLDRINLDTSADNASEDESLIPYLGTINVSNIDRSTQTIIENGGKSTNLKMPVTDGYWCICVDPAKNMFGLFQEEEGVEKEEYRSSR